MTNSSLFVGVVQTSLDALAAWRDEGSGKWEDCIRMSFLEERRAKKEIRHFLASLRGLEHSPDIVLLPELSVPIGYEGSLMRAAEKLESIIIAGLDYRIALSEDEPTVFNEAVVIVPRKMKGRQISQRTEIRRVGKTYPAPAEKKKLSEISGGGVAFRSQPTVWLFESEDFGNFAVAVCYDFLDLDRIVLYRNKIQTLFILAYNKDTTSFDHIAESIARTVFCNVVICNCGQFGGSLAVSPFREPYKRSVYRHSGQNLPNAQMIKLPLADLMRYQSTGEDEGRNFKSLPPGFPSHVPLTQRVENI